jgi:hypothetical protein
MAEDSQNSNNSPVDETTLSSKLLISAMGIQFLGITAAGIAFFVFLFSRLGHLTSLEGLRLFWLVAWPVLVAYALWGVIGIVWLIAWISVKAKMKYRVAFFVIYWLFIFLDTLLLGFLVWWTGGPSISIFTPIFLLIPALAACYCNPSKKPFIKAVIVVCLVFGIVWKYAPKEVNPGILRIDTARTSKVTESEYLWSGVLTLVCVITAAFAQWITDTIRKSYCEDIRKKGDNTPRICENLYI